MSLASPVALLLLGTLGALFWLVLRPQRPQPMVVGTLMLWRRVAAATQAASRSTRRLDALLWLLAAALALGAAAAARPLWASAAGTPQVDVYVERLEAAGPEPDLDAIALRLSAAAPGAMLRFWSAGVLDGLGAADVRALQPGPLEAEIAQFEAGAGRSRVYVLCSPESRPGLVLPRASLPRAGVVYEARVTEGVLKLAMTGGATPALEGAAVAGTNQRGRELEITADVQSANIRVSVSGRAIALRRRAQAVGVGEDWAGARHLALLRALQPDTTGDRQPEIWLGGDSGVPGIRIHQGVAAPVGDTQVDAQHALFRELPLGQIQFGQRAMPPRADRRTLARAGEAGDLAALSADGKVLFFAGDPFTESSVAAATLLLDNAIGVVTGLRASERQSYVLDGPLPSRHQALADSFEPVGTLEAPVAQESAVEFGVWLMLAAVACSVFAAFSVNRRAGGAPQA